MSQTHQHQHLPVTRDDATGQVLVPDSQMSESLASSTQSQAIGLQSPITTISQSDSGDAVITPLSSQSQSQNQSQNSQIRASLELGKPEAMACDAPCSYTPSIEMDVQQIREANHTPSSSSRGSRSPSHGTKRTASGIIKAPSPALIAKSVDSRGGGTVKKTGLGSLKISELSLQLKTNLKYAMIKVQNGWEQNTIDEVESLAASQLSSPVSTTGTMVRGPGQSPRVAMAGMHGRPAHRDMLQPGYRLTDTSRPGTSGSSWPNPLSASPELYDRHHVSAPVPVPTLAPAPDLRPMSRHRRADSKQSSAHTPSMRGTTPTPQEQDAVDTLLFMSSPANSSRFRNAQATTSNTQNSPSRSQFAMPRRQLGLGMEPPILINGTSGSSGDEIFAPGKRGVGTADAERQAKRRSFGKLLKTDRDVEDMLDRMEDAGSSGEEGIGGTRVPTVRRNPVDVRT